MQIGNNAPFARQKAIMASIQAHDVKIQAHEITLRLMNALKSIDNPRVKARVLLAHYRRCPESRLNQYPAYAKLAQERILRSWAKNELTTAERSQVAKYNQRLINIERGNAEV